MEEGGIKGHYSHFMEVETETARWEAMWLRESGKVWLQAAAEQDSPSEQSLLLTWCM